MEKVLEKDYILKFARDTYDEKDLSTIEAFITTYCYINDIYNDTCDWEFLIDDVWETLSEETKNNLHLTRKQFELTMSKNLI